MTTIVTRAGKGSPLTNNEVDQNFINLNTAKYELPDPTGNSGKFLTTNGTTTSWGTVDLTPYITAATAASTYVALAGSYANPSWITSLAETKVLPSQTSNSGKYLTTNGTSTSWSTIDLSLYAPLASPTFTGVPLAPTAAVDTNTTQLATTAYVVGQGYLKSATAASTYVALTGNQTVAGSKLFSGSISVGGANTPATNLDVQTTGTNTLTSLFTTGLSDTNFRIGAMNGAAGSTGTTQGKLGLFYLGVGETATIDFRRGGSTTDGSIAFRTSGTDRATLDNSGNFTATGNVTAYSDERLKDNIEVIPDALAKVESVRGVTFTRKSDGEAGMGVIAQEIRKIAPEVVMIGADGMMSVAYGNLVGLLIEAVKDLSGQVKVLQAKVG